MPRRREIRSVLQGFLGHYTSRYSDFGGYWLFGMLVAHLADRRIDLLGATDGALDQGASAMGDPLAMASHLAEVTFRDQMGKVGLDLDVVTEASLQLAKAEGTATARVNGQVVDGFELVFRVKVVSDLGTVYEQKASVFVAPHDPARELRSTRR